MSEEQTSTEACGHHLYTMQPASDGHRLSRFVNDKLQLLLCDSLVVELFSSTNFAYARYSEKLYTHA